MLPVCCPFVIIRMFSVFVRMLSVCIRMLPYVVRTLPVCCPYVSVCHRYVARMFFVCCPYVTCMYSVYVTRLCPCFSVRENFEKRKPHFEYSLCQKGYSLTLVQEIQTEVKFAGRKEALRNKTKQTNWEILSVGYHLQHNLATPNLKTILTKHWHIIQQQPKLKQIFNQLPIVSYS